MPHRVKLSLIALAAAAASVLLASCGTGGIQVSKTDPTYHGAVIFSQHCAGCHTFKAAGTEGGASERSNREKVDGPNFNDRKETVGNVLYALRHGGYSGQIMPKNILVGKPALEVAQFVAKFSGSEAERPSGPGSGSGG